VNNGPLLDDLRLFCLVARRSSFAGSANELGTSAAYVTKRIALLEKALSTRLLHRTTRSVTVTADGETVYRWAQKILNDVAQMTDEVASTRTEPRGSMRISTSFRLGRKHIAPAISALARKYPALDIALELVDRPVDLISDGFDLDIRIGDVPEPHLIAHRIAEGHRILCAAPAYLQRQGHPKKLSDLSQHSCLVFRERNQAFGVWRLQGPDSLETVKVTGPLSSNNNDVIWHWALDGHGILRTLAWDAAPHLASGELVQVLPNYQWKADIWAVTSSRLAASAKVRVCVRFLQEHLTSGEFALASGQQPKGN
jgi:LysR family transcriptional activator of dmlA